LDQEEFREKVSMYSAEDAQRAEEAVSQLLEMIRRREHPFDTIERFQG
jgi:hypothetical protein